MPKGEAVVAEISGTLHVDQSEKYADLREVTIEHSELVSDEYSLPEDWKFAVKDEAEKSKPGMCWQRWTRRRSSPSMPGVTSAWRKRNAR